MNDKCILKNNDCVGYLVPSESLGEGEHTYATHDEVVSAMADLMPRTQPVLDYLKDK